MVDRLDFLNREQTFGIGYNGEQIQIPEISNKSELSDAFYYFIRPNYNKFRTIVPTNSEVGLLVSKYYHYSDFLSDLGLIKELGAGHLIESSTVGSSYYAQPFDLSETLHWRKAAPNTVVSNDFQNDYYIIGPASFECELKPQIRDGLIVGRGSRPGDKLALFARGSVIVSGSLLVPERSQVTNGMMIQGIESHISLPDRVHILRNPL